MQSVGWVDGETLRFCSSLPETFRASWQGEFARKPTIENVCRMKTRMLRLPPESGLPQEQLSTISKAFMPILEIFQEVFDEYPGKDDLTARWKDQPGRVHPLRQG
jgi:hypothetical protein